MPLISLALHLALDLAFRDRLAQVGEPAARGHDRFPAEDPRIPLRGRALRARSSFCGAGRHGQWRYGAVMSFGVAAGPCPSPVQLPGPSLANERYRWECLDRGGQADCPAVSFPSRTTAAGHNPIMRGNRGISATPCATAHGAHSGTCTSPPRSVGSRRVITARLSHIPMSSGCDVAQTHSQSRWPQTRVVRQDSSTARMAGSLESLWNASLVMAAVCSAHSVATAVAASQAAANCRNGLFSPLMTTSSHLERVVGNRIMLVHPSSRPSPRPDPLPILQAHLAVSSGYAVAGG